MDIFNTKYNEYISNNRPIPFIDEDAIEFYTTFIKGYNTKWIFIIIISLLFVMPNVLFTKNIIFILIFILCYFTLLFVLYYIFKGTIYKTFLYNIYIPIALYNKQFGLIFCNSFKNDVLKHKDNYTKSIILDILIKIDRI